MCHGYLASHGGPLRTSSVHGIAGTVEEPVSALQGLSLYASYSLTVIGKDGGTTYSLFRLLQQLGTSL